MRFDVVTIFPELIAAFAEVGLIGKAQQSGALTLCATSPRAFTADRHQSVDDAPYGGGSGMVMTPEPLLAAIEACDARAAQAGAPRNRRVLLTPSGVPFDQARAREYATLPGLTLVCGRYEGVDERVAALCDDRVSLGDFVLNGGEVAAMALIEAVSRLIPGVLGNQESLTEESYEAGLLEYPQYTRPRVFRGMEVPAELLSGNHAEIAAWRKRRSLERTRAMRPDLLGADDSAQPAPRPPIPPATLAGARVYAALLHHPVLDRAGETVTTAVTTLDVHDIARSARSFGLAGYYVVTPIEAQHQLVDRILEHWQSGAGQKRTPERGDALALCRPACDLAEVQAEIEAREGRPPRLWATSARPGSRTTLAFAEARALLGDPEAGPVLILLGTGHGIAHDVVGRADALLEPIAGSAVAGGYNHLSVRSAAAIVFDRLLGAGFSTTSLR